MCLTGRDDLGSIAETGYIVMNRIYVSGLVYEENPPFDSWFKWLIGGIIGLTLVIGLSLIPVDVVGAWFMLGITVFLALVFYSIIPRKYQIFEDRVRIVMGGPFSVNAKFSNIKEIRAASNSSANVYGGIRLATTSANVVEIVSKKGLGIVISPRDRDTFLQQVNQAMANYAKMNPDSNN
jgi:hypothetical protein